MCENISTCLPASRARLLVRREIFFRWNSVVSLRPPMLHERTREGKVRSTLRRQRCLLHKRVSTDRFPPIDSADREHQILCFPLKSLLPHIVVHDRCGRTNLCSILVYSRTFFSREPPATLRVQFRNGRGSYSPAASINRSFSRNTILPNQGTKETNRGEPIVFTTPQFSPTRSSQSSSLGCYSC